MSASNSKPWVIVVAARFKWKVRFKPQPFFHPDPKVAVFSLHAAGHYWSAGCLRFRLRQSLGAATTRKYGAGGEPSILHTSTATPKNLVCISVRWLIHWQHQPVFFLELPGDPDHDIGILARSVD